MKKHYILFPFLFFAFFLQAQEQPAANDSSIKGQFDDAINNSNSWENFKVVKKTTMNDLRENVLDSIAKFQAKITELNGEIAQQEQQINTLTKDLNTTQEDLAFSKEKEDGIEIMGTIMEKSTYNTILWSIIGLLIAALVFFIYKFNTSNSVTKEAQLKLAEMEIEFDAHRQKKLEEQQQLRRKLQDEINKNKKLT